jgi:hypothetical protein
MTSHTQAGRNEFPTTSWTLVVAAGDHQHRDCRVFEIYTGPDD